MPPIQTLSALVLSMALTAAPAFAQGASKPDTETMQHPITTATGASVPFMLHHAYGEAVHAYQSQGMGMTEMAKNHYENVGIALDQVANSKTPMDAMSQRLVRDMRDRAKALAASPSEASGRQLVAQFASFFNTAPKAMHGGSPGKMPTEAAMHTPADLVAMAQSAMVDTQVDSAMQDFKGAALHIQHAVTAMDNAKQSAKTANLPADQVRQIDSLSQAVRRVSTLIDRKSPEAATEAANVVLRITRDLPAMMQSATARMGHR